MDVKKKYIGIQSEAKKYADQLSMLGSDGCLFLCICSIAEDFNEAFHTGKRVDILRCFIDWKNKGYLKDGFWCEDSLSMLEDATGYEWEREIVKALPETLLPQAYTVEKWRGQLGGTHFKRRWGDTLNSSATVRSGTLESYYIYTAKMR